MEWEGLLVLVIVVAVLLLTVLGLNWNYTVKIINYLLTVFCTKLGLKNISLPTFPEKPS